MSNKAPKINYKEFISEIFDNSTELDTIFKNFHNYSLLNQWYAYTQLRKSEPINTYKGWQKLGRQVKKGQKAIALLMPITVKAKDDDGDETGAVFTRYIMPKRWFGLSQTDGEPLNIDKLEININTESFLKKLDIELVDFELSNGNVGGYAQVATRQIAINPTINDVTRVLIHEAAHVVLGHTGDMNRADKELEAEATSYFVCKYLGIDTDSSIAKRQRGYIQGWIKRDDVKESSYKNVVKAIDTILKAAA